MRIGGDNGLGGYSYLNVYNNGLKTYREIMAEKDYIWCESLLVSATDWGGDFDTTLQTINKIYTPVTTVGENTLAVVSNKGFTGKTATLFEVVVTTAGAMETAKFKWRKKTYLGNTWGDWTTDVTTAADNTLADGVQINWTGITSVKDDAYKIQAVGSWHTPADGKTSYLTNIAIYTYDSDKAAKAGIAEVWNDDMIILEHISTATERSPFRTPHKLVGDGTKQYKVQVADITKADLEYVLITLKGWDE